MQSKLNDAAPSDWNKARDNYLKAIEDAEIGCAVRDHTDPVNKPDHYNQGAIEAINYIRQQLGTGFVEYCQGNVIKYTHRWKYKNGIEDLKKAQWYLNRMIEELEE